MAYALTEKQAQLLAFIKEYTADNNGVCPSFEEMKAAVDLASKSGIHRLIRALEERGFISRLKDRARAIKVLADDTPPEGLTAIPSYLLVAELARRAAQNRSGL